MTPGGPQSKGGRSGQARAWTWGQEGVIGKYGGTENPGTLWPLPPPMLPTLNFKQPWRMPRATLPGVCEVALPGASQLHSLSGVFRNFPSPGARGRGAQRRQ